MFSFEFLNGHISNQVSTLKVICRDKNKFDFKSILLYMVHIKNVIKRKLLKVFKVKYIWNLNYELD